MPGLVRPDRLAAFRRPCSPGVGAGRLARLVFPTATVVPCGFAGGMCATPHNHKHRALVQGNICTSQHMTVSAYTHPPRLSRRTPRSAPSSDRRGGAGTPVWLAPRHPGAHHPVAGKGGSQCEAQGGMDSRRRFATTIDAPVASASDAPVVVDHSLTSTVRRGTRPWGSAPPGP